MGKLVKNSHLLCLPVMTTNFHLLAILGIFFYFMYRKQKTEIFALWQIGKKNISQLKEKKICLCPNVVEIWLLHVKFKNDYNLFTCKMR